MNKSWVVPPQKKSLSVDLQLKSLLNYNLKYKSSIDLLCLCIVLHSMLVLETVPINFPVNV